MNKKGSTDVCLPDPEMSLIRPIEKYNKLH